MAQKLKRDELMRLAFYYAEQDRMAFLDSIAHCGADYDEIRDETEMLVRQLRCYRMKRWDRSQGEAKPQ